MVKYNEKVCCAQILGSHDQGQGHSYRFIPSKSSIHNNSKGLSNSEKGKTKYKALVPITQVQGHNCKSYVFYPTNGVFTKLRKAEVNLIIFHRKDN